MGLPAPVDIANLALQLLGAKRIAALTDLTPSARAMNLLYERIRQSELRKNDWNFAISRASLAADSPAPTWGRANSFSLPADFIRLTGSYPELANSDFFNIGITVAYTSTLTGYRDWVIEGKKILTNDQAPLNVRYIADITDTTQWDPLFVTSTAAAMAYAACEELTQSNTKKNDVGAFYKSQVDEAKKANSIEIVPIDPPPDTWITVRG